MTAPPPDLPPATGATAVVWKSDIQVKLLQKIEELTLHVIDLDKRNRFLENKVQELSKEKSIK